MAQRCYSGSLWWPNPPFWHADAERMLFHSSLFPAFPLGLVVAPLELSRLQLSNFVSHCWRQGEHVHLSNREEIPHCPHSLAAYSAKWLQISPAGSKLGRTEGEQLSAPSLHTHTHTVQQGCWLKQSNNTSNKVLLPLGSCKLWRVCACAPPWLQTHQQGRAAGQSRIKSLADSSAIC